MLDCAAGGFSSFPTLGLKALKNTWNFDFQQVYVGAGMICPLIVDWSIMLGAIACYVSCSIHYCSCLHAMHVRPCGSASVCERQQILPLDCRLQGCIACCVIAALLPLINV